MNELTLRVSTSPDTYEEARAAGLHAWEQVQSYGVRHPPFRSSKRPWMPTDDAPALVRWMADAAAAAGVGPMFVFRAAVVEHVARHLAPHGAEIVVSCDPVTFVVARHRARLPIRGATHPLGIVVRPELGPHGVHSETLRGGHAVTVVATSAPLASGAATAVAAIAERRGVRAALDHARGVEGVHGAVFWSNGTLGVAGDVELA